MKNIRTLFEYQMFDSNRHLQKKIDKITEKYLSAGTELEDDELNVAAAGEVHQSATLPPEENANRK